LITNVLRFKYLSVLKKYSTNKIPAFGVILLFMISSLSAAYPQTLNSFENRDKAIVWDVSLSFDEPGSAYDYTIFGEAPDANDGPPADAYDTAKPPAPMLPYIRAWFNDNLPSPYNALWEDYRHYPATNKIWNLSVKWEPEDSVSPTTITINWSSSEINTTEYNSIILCTNGGTPLQDMLAYNLYSFVCPASITQRFKIICAVNQPNQPPNVPSAPSPANGSTGVSVNANLGWTGGDPNAGDTVLYDVYFGTSSSPPHMGFNQSGLSYDPGLLAYNTLYYWRIVAWDNHGAMTAGPLWHFTTGVQPNQPPYIPSAPSPANGSTSVSVNVNLGWTGGDPNAGDTVLYDVYFGTSSSPPIVSHNQSSVSYDPGTLAYFTIYYWKIVAWDNHGASTAGPRWQFRTAYLPNQPPCAPYNPSPADGSSQIPVNADLSWACFDPDSGDFITYDVYFGCTFPLTKIKSNTSGTSCMLDNLNYSMKYYWQVVAWDNHQNTNASPQWSFTTKTDTSPPSLAITSPKKGYVHINLLGGIIHKNFPILITTLVIGQVDVNATASDSESGVNRVEFYIDNDLKAIDYTAPYSWPWVDRGFFFPYLVTVKAYDNVGNPSSLSLRVWKIL
jgi:hypothetical protein